MPETSVRIDGSFAMNSRGRSVVPRRPLRQGKARRPIESIDLLEPPNVPGDFFKALALIERVAGVVVDQAIQMNVFAAETFEMGDHPAQHFSPQAAALKVAAHRQDIDEAQRRALIDCYTRHCGQLAFAIADE